MENNEIMVNEEVMEVAERVDKVDYSNFKTVIGIGVAGVGGWLAYKFIVKPMIAKVKAKKENQDTFEGDYELLDDEDSFDDEEN